MNNKTFQLYLDQNDHWLGYVDSNGDIQHVRTDVQIDIDHIRITDDGFLQILNKGTWEDIKNDEGSLVSLKGPKGDTGETGPQGPQGEQGLQGRPSIFKGTISTPTDMDNKIAEGAQIGDSYIISGVDDSIQLPIDERNGAVYTVIANDYGLLWIYSGNIRGQKGADGKDGADGQNGVNGKDGTNGLTPYVGENGNWFIGEEDTSVKAQGELGPQGETGAAGIDGNTPQLKVEDGFWKVSYDNGDSWEQIAEYVGKSDINTVNQEINTLKQSVQTLSEDINDHDSNLTEINNLLFQGGDWFEDMEELNPEVTGFDQEYSDIPHYVMYHNNILQKNINYESGELPEGESYPLYGEHEGYGDPAYITYNLYGDYCTVSVSNLLLINGQADIYFRLPVEPVEETNTTFMAREGSNYQLVCCTVGHHDYSYTGITEPVLWFRPCEADTYNTDYHISLTITYKYRNNEDF